MKDKYICYDCLNGQHKHCDSNNNQGCDCRKENHTMNTPTIEGNKLIAEFMGGKVEQFVWIKYEPMGVSFAEQVHGLQAHLLHDLEYHTSWDWLMPVVKKIADLMLNKDWEDDKPLNEAISRWRPIANELEKINLENVWFCVVKFITWYNQQNPKQ